MEGKKIAAEAPSYAPDGSRGYMLRVTDENGTVNGWIQVGDDGAAVYVSIDRAPWRQVGTVASRAELNLIWIAEHAEAILQPS
ncbi:hypothetical protein BKG82_27115 [Mycobacteroides chelonae]|uniref:Uncharacterized protein n=1 Tax=Mycobacteroides chelonae TaxID=1774 RepID=A0A1S1LGP6_MYCCH|nr:hypothetical protein [Mycobacteroides chelonae]OHU47325.1 hypothetical protein BKG82_27115 [Mycobacteroides chelonae]